MGALEDIAGSFDINPYLRVGSGATRRSSFRNGTQGALVFYWQAPPDAAGNEGRVYIIRTQAPYIIEAIQSDLRVPSDGRFGDATRRAAVAAMRADGLVVPDNEPALGPMMGYLLARALFRGQGRVGFPARVEWPDIHTALRASGSNSTVSVFDIAAGRDVPIGANGLPAPAPPVVPTTPPVPTPAPAPELPPAPAPPTVDGPRYPLWATPSRYRQVMGLGENLLLVGAPYGAAALTTGIALIASGRKPL